MLKMMKLESNTKTLTAIIMRVVAYKYVLIKLKNISIIKIQSGKVKILTKQKFSQLNLFQRLTNNCLQVSLVNFILNQIL